jgi:thiosulfate dehydrogenase [quinone] large subunit
VNSPKNVSEEFISGPTIAILRVGMGLNFLFAAYDKLRRESYAESMDFIFNVHWKDAAYSFYRPFVDAVVLPNLELFAALVTYGELAIAVGLIFGIFTCAASVAAIFLSLNIIFASGEAILSLNVDVGFILLSTILFVGAAGRNGGIDSLLVEWTGPPQDWKRLLY